jgi:hypothetical protein
MDGARLIFITKTGSRDSSALPAGRLHAKKFLVAGLLAGILCTALISPRAEPASFCELCDARQEETSWMVRGTGASLIKTHAIEPTPMSELLVKKNLVTAHIHRWRQPQAVRNPLDEFGPPVIESLEFINAPRVVGFMRDLADYGDSDSITKWRDVLLRPQYSYVIDDALRFLLVPPDGFTNRTAFMAWWSSNGFALYNRLRELTEPD